MPDSLAQRRAPPSPRPSPASGRGRTRTGRVKARTGNPARSEPLPETSSIPAWVLALGTTLGMQTVASFLNQSLAIIAPLLTAGVGLAPERVGNLSSLSSLGTVL